MHKINPFINLLNLYSFKITFIFLLVPILFVKTNAQNNLITPYIERWNPETEKLIFAQSWTDSVPIKNIGPTSMGGRVVDLSVNPKKPIEFLIAYASGGLFYTKNNGQSFVSIFENQPTLNMGAVAVDWQERKIWLATGEANSSRSSYAGIGIFYSDNWGKTWQFKGLPETHHIGRIAIDHKNNKKIYVAALGKLYNKNKERGVFVSEDNGNTWSHTLFIDDSTGVVDLVQDPLNADIIYASSWHRQRSAWNFLESGKSSGIYKSIDGGKSWKLITNGNGFPNDDGVGRIGLAVSYKTPGLVFASLDNQNSKPKTNNENKKTENKLTIDDFKNISKDSILKLDDKILDSFLVKTSLKDKITAKKLKEKIANGTYKPDVIYDYFLDANARLFKTDIIGLEIYKSTNGGDSWVKMNKKDLRNYNTYGYYFGRIDISPQNDNLILSHGFNLLMSKDAGQTFSVTDKNNSTHPDWHGAWINPLDTAHWIAVNDGGCNITYDEGNNWFKVNTPAVGQFYAVGVDNKKDYTIFGGLQDNGSWYAKRSMADQIFDYEMGSNWKRLNGGDGMQAKRGRKNYVYSGYQFGYYSQIDLATEKDTSIRPEHNLGEPHYRYNWQTPILVSPHDSSLVYYGANYLFALGNDGLKENYKSNIDLTNGFKQGDVPYGTLTTIDESILQKGLIFTGSDDGLIHRSFDGGRTFENITANIVHPNLPDKLWVSEIVCSQFSKNRVYVSLNGYRYDHFKPYIFFSDNQGATWQPIMGNLPNEPINAICETAQGEIFVGTDQGLYISKNNGVEYYRLKNLPRVAVHDLVQQKQANELVIATHGRSIYVLDLKKMNEKFQLFNHSAINNAKNKKDILREGVDLPCPPPSPNKKIKKQKIKK